MPLILLHTRARLIALTLLSLLGLGVINISYYPYPPIEGQYHRAYGSPSALPPHECLPPIMQVDSDYLSVAQWGGGVLDQRGIVVMSAQPAPYRPYYIAHLGMTALHAACNEDDPLGYAIALRHADWLVANADWRGEVATWHYNYANHDFRAGSGWISSLSQGAAAVLLIQAYHQSPQSEYLATAKGALAAFGVSVEQGGVVIPVEQGVWYAGVAPQRGSPSLLLNYQLYALETLVYLSEYLPSQDALGYYQHGLLGLHGRLADFDTGSSVLYSLNPRVDKPIDHYQYTTIISRLYWLYDRTGDPYWLSYADRWQGYTGKPRH